MSGAALLPCVQDRDDPLRDVNPTMAEFVRPFLHLAHDKAQPRRFAEQPEPHSAFADLRDEDAPDEEAELQRDMLRNHMERCR